MCLYRISHIFVQIALLVFSLLSHALQFHQNIISSSITPKILGGKKKEMKTTKTKYHFVWFAGRQSIIQDPI